MLFGGTFDPVHHGHLIVSRAVAEALGVAKVVLIPAANPPHKPGAVASAQQRLEMLRLAIEGEDLFEISTVELHRQGSSYTLDTLLELRRTLGADLQFKWLIGADMLEDLPLWHRVGEVLAEAQMVIAVRPPWQERMGAILDRLEPRLGVEAVGRLRQSVVPSPIIDISSTLIRGRIRDRKSVRYFVPENVQNYIARHGIYKT